MDDYHLVMRNKAGAIVFSGYINEETGLRVIRVLKPSELPAVDTNYLRKLTRKLVEHKLVVTCISCEHFDAEKEQCALARARPPAEVILYGCEQWTDGVF